MRHSSAPRRRRRAGSRSTAPPSSDADRPAHSGMRTMFTSHRTDPARGSQRSMVLGRGGMVCTSQPLASFAGAEMLRGGGNAVDAAVARGRRARRRRAVHDRHRRRLLHADLARRRPAPLRPQRQRARAARGDARGAARARPQPACRCSACCRSPCPARSTPGAARWSASAAARWPTCWRRRSTTPRTASRSARSSPCSGASPSGCSQQPEARRTFTIDGRAPRLGEHRAPARSGAQPARARRRRSRRLLPRRAGRADRRLLARLRRPARRRRPRRAPLRLGRADRHRLPRPSRLRAAAERAGADGAAGAQHPRVLRPRRAGRRSRRASRTCRSKRSSSPSPTATATSPIPRTRRCRSRELLSKDYAQGRAALIDRARGAQAHRARPHAGRRRHRVPHRRRRRRQRRVADQQPLSRLRLRHGRRRHRHRAAEPRLRLLARPGAPQLHRARQAAVPHHHSRRCC